MRRMYSLEQLIALIKNHAPIKTIDATNITELTKEQLDELQVGDVVQKVTGNQKHSYMVTYKGDGAGEGICLTYVAAGYMETISYDRTESGWAYNSKDVVEVPTSQDIQNMLIGKYVRIMDTPSSTGTSVVLNDAQIEQISEGVFINGTFLGANNPVLIPITQDETTRRGIFIGELYVRKYQINLQTKTISIDSGAGFIWFSNAGLRFSGVTQLNSQNVVTDMIKLLSLTIPADASEKTYVPKLVNGVWTLVEEV